MGCWNKLTHDKVIFGFLMAGLIVVLFGQSRDHVFICKHCTPLCLWCLSEFWRFYNPLLNFIMIRLLLNSWSRDLLSFASCLFVEKVPWGWVHIVSQNCDLKWLTVSFLSLSFYRKLLLIRRLGFRFWGAGLWEMFLIELVDLPIMDRFVVN